MLLEHAVLEVKPAETEAFEGAFAEALPLIMSSRGCHGVRLDRCLERENRYLLLVEWESLEDHTQVFRGSAAYERWRDLLHHFYEPMPTVEHYRPVAGVPSSE